MKLSDIKMIFESKSIKKNIPEPIKYLVKYFVHCMNFDPFICRSYSQEGEDLILKRLFNKQDGFYVDVGAHHPRRFSNTFLFYKKGWKGINIDAMPGSMKLFKEQRSRDINLEIPIAKEHKALTYFQFNEPALNTFCHELALSRKEPYRIIEKQSMEAFPLKEILEKHLTKGQFIDFLSVDVEGLDLEVLQSNDWSRFRPKVVLVEKLYRSLHQLQDEPIHYFMTDQNYQFFAKAVNTTFYISNEFLADL